MPEPGPRDPPLEDTVQAPTQVEPQSPQAVLHLPVHPKLPVHPVRQPPLHPALPQVIVQVPEHPPVQLFEQVPEQLPVQL